MQSITIVIDYFEASCRVKKFYTRSKAGLSLSSLCQTRRAIDSHQLDASYILMKQSQFCRPSATDQFETVTRAFSVTNSIICASVVSAVNASAKDAIVFSSRNWKWRKCHEIRHNLRVHPGDCYSRSGRSFVSQCESDVISRVALPFRIRK